jgi:outer membrane receptor protein involved in Fe transport
MHTSLRFHRFFSLSRLRRGGAFACALGLAQAISVSTAAGSAAPTGPAPSIAPPGDVVELAEFAVAGVPVALSANPLVRPVTGAFGEARSLLDTPRAVSVITPALLRERGIDGLRDVVAFAPGAYVPSRFGKATVPNLRGDTGESYLDGQRRSYNLFGFFPSFNHVEALELVRGPGSAVYGAGFFSGGYVNYVAKRPQFVDGATTATLRLGTWVPGGGSHAEGSVQLDHTARLRDDDSLAWRLSYEGKGGRTFYRRHGVRDDRQDLYLALAWHPRPDLAWNLSAQYLWQSSPEILGVNRPSPELVTRGLYYAGASPDAFPFPGLVPATGPVRLPRDATLFSWGDFSNANVYLAQSTLTLGDAAQPRLIARTLVEHVNRRRYHAFEYAEWVEQTTVDQRLELPRTFTAWGREHRTVTGGALRFEDRLSFTNYFNEYFYNFDLTQPGPYVHATAYPSSYFPGLPGPGGRLFFGAAAGSPETTDSQLWHAALFHQHEVILAPGWALLAGARLDGFSARARDPLPFPNTTAWHDRDHSATPSAHLSIMHRPSPRTALYATWQRARAVNGNVTGGGLMLYGPEGTLARDDFRNLSVLHELGAKLALVDNTLFAGLALFDQSRARAARGGGKDDIRVRGLEVEFVYQPHLDLTATFNAAWIDGRYRDSAPFQLGGRTIYAFYPVGQGPLGRGTGTGYTFGNQVEPGDWRIPGLSRLSFDGSVDWRVAGGWSVGLWGGWQSRQTGNLDAEWIIPAQFTLNARLGYRAPPAPGGRWRWEAAVEVLNLTDEDNWIHNGDTFMNNQIVFRDLPRRVGGWVKIAF